MQAVKPTIYNSATGRLLANVTLKQRYRIITPVGKGGMGAVYKAEDTQLGNRQVALKEMSQSGLSPQEQKEAANAFRQEAIMLARLQHPNLPNIFDHFEENGRWYLVMSFLEGETLEDYFSHAQGGKLPLDEVLQIGIQLCTVLAYLHHQQPAIIFRDLKPANIMRTPDGHIYLIDFGIARHFKSGQAKDTAYYGTMGYAPPEQYGKAQTTPRSDIYSLGATLYEMLSGYGPSQSPFTLPPLPSLVPTAPAGLTTLLTQMLELDEDKRPASMLLVKQELQALASPTAPKPSTPAPSPASVAPTQLAKPTPGSSSAAPMQLASSSAASAPAPLPAKGARAKRRVSRRTVITTGVAGVVVVGGGALVWNVSRSKSSPSSASITPTQTSALLYIYRGHSSQVIAVAWSPNGKRIASGSNDGTVQVWDATNGGNVYTYHGHSDGVEAVAWSPDGKRIASGNFDHTVQVWDATNGGNVYTYHGHSFYVEAVAWSPDGKRIASGSVDNTVQVWQPG